MLEELIFFKNRSFEDQSIMVNIEYATFEMILGSLIFNIFDIKNAIVKVKNIEYFGRSKSFEQLSDGTLFSLSNSSIIGSNIYIRDLE